MRVEISPKESLLLSTLHRNPQGMEHGQHGGPPSKVTHDETNARCGLCPLGLGVEDGESQTPSEKGEKSFEQSSAGNGEVSPSVEQRRQLCPLQEGMP